MVDARGRRGGTPVCACAPGVCGSRAVPEAAPPEPCADFSVRAAAPSPALNRIVKSSGFHFRFMAVFP